MSELEDQLKALVAENKRQIEKLELQNLYAERLLGLRRDIPPQDEVSDLLAPLARITELTDSTINQDVRDHSQERDNEENQSSVADVVLGILKENKVPMKSADIFESLQDLRPDTPRSTFDAVINRLEGDSDYVVKLKRGVYQYLKS